MDRYRFEVGSSYYPYDSGMPSITIMKRTEKTIWVSNGQNEWRMRIRIDDNGDEWAMDSSVPKRWQIAFLYNSRDKV